MAKEALYSPYNKLIFRETFNDEFTVRKNPYGKGTPTNVTFENGVATSISTSRITYPKRNLGIASWSFECRFKKTTQTSNYQTLFGNDGTTGNWEYISISPINRIVISDSTNFQVKTAATTIQLNTWYHLVVTWNGSLLKVYLNGVEDLSTSWIIGTKFELKNVFYWYSVTYTLRGQMDYVNMYSIALTASEVKNLFDNDWNTDIVDTPTITTLLNHDSTTGIVTKDRTGLNTLTATSVENVKIGNAWSNKYSGGITSKIDCGGQLVTNQTILAYCWFNIEKFESTTEAQLFNNGTFALAAWDSAGGRLYFTRTGASTPIGNFTFSKNKWFFCAVLSEGTGIYRYSLYIADLNTAPVSIANGTHAAPVAPSVNLTIGNGKLNAALIGKEPIAVLKTMSSYDTSAAIELLTQAWSETKIKMFN